LRSGLPWPVYPKQGTHTMATTPKKKTSKTTAKAETPATPKKTGRTKAAPARKATPRSKTAPAAATTVAAVPAEGTNDAIAVRAYYIAEKRQRCGLPGDPAQDWLEAENQIRAEQAGS